VSAIAWELPEDVRAARDGLLDFARKEILPRHRAHHDLFEDARRLYREDGRFSDELKALIDEVRRVSAKAYSVQVGYRAVDRAMQTHGAMGFTNEVGLHHAWHALRIVNVADGTNEILNRGIVQRLLKGDVEL
jgi:hypothetical protein